MTRIRFVYRRVIVFCFALALLFQGRPESVVKASEGGAQGDRSAEERLTDGWRRVVPLSRPVSDGPRIIGRRREPAKNSPVDHATAWVEKGWLTVERRTAAGGLEWQIILAEVKEDDAPPDIESNDEYGIFRLSFRGGRYAVREERGLPLRCVRQRKTGTNWPHVIIPPADDDSEVFVASRPPKGKNDPHGPAVPAVHEMPYIFERTIGSWQFVGVGPAPGLVDCLVRLTHRQLDREENIGRNIITGPFGGVVEARHGDWYRLMDDGEMLVANRVEQWSAELDLNRLARQAKLIGKPPREFGEGEWLNTDRPLAWDDWQGRVVLLYVETVRNTTDRRALPIGINPQLNYLSEKYADRGLAVIGIVEGVKNEDQEAAAEQKAAIAQTMKGHRMTWPCKLESARAKATNYEFGHGYPHCVLIGRDGRVASVFSGRLPAQTEIEKLLEAQ